MKNKHKNTNRYVGENYHMSSFYLKATVWLRLAVGKIFLLLKLI